MTTRSNPWIQVFKPRERATARLICLPFAGGGAQSFSRWPEHLPEEIELCAVQLPGRETRLRDKPIADAAALVTALLPALRPLLDKPFFLYGHSMGALLAHELACRLQAEGGPEPQRLLVSGRVAPQCKPPRSPIHGLPEDEFIAALRNLNGTPEEVLADAELMSVIGPMLRADFSVNETYEHGSQPKLRCGVVAFGGLRDPEAPRAGLDAWRAVTDGQFLLRMVPGDHFFIQSAQALFLRMVSILLYQATSRLPTAVGSAELAS